MFDDLVELAMAEDTMLDELERDDVAEMYVRAAEMRDIALKAFETTSGPTQAMHACWVQMAADHISWAFEDWFVLADIESVDEDVKRLRQLRREYEEAVRAYTGSSF